MSFFPKIELVVDDWRKSFRFWSIRMGGVFTAFVMYAFNNLDQIASVLNSLPPEARAWMTPFIGFALFVVIWFFRIVKQAKLSDADTAKPDTPEQP